MRPADREKHSKGQGQGDIAAPAPDLLAYYKQRCEDFDKERSEMLETVGRLTQDAAERHKLEWENRKRTDEVRELQKAVSDAHAFLFEERQRLLTLQAANDELRLQEIEDRKRIQQLLGGSDPGGRPRQAQPTQYTMDALLLKIESLQAQLHEQKQLASERIAALLEDRRIREGEEAAHRQVVNQQLEEQATELARVEEQLRQTTKDYILAKRERQGSEERAIVAEATLHAEQQRAAEELAALKKGHDREVTHMRRSADAKLEDITSNLRQQLRAKEDELTNLSSVHSALKGQYEQRLLELEDKVTKLRTTNKQLEARRHLDMDGFTADISYLRKMLTAVDRKLHEMRLVERLEDDERLDNILATLRRKAPVPSAPAHQAALLAAAGAGEAAGRDTVPPSDTGSVKGELAQGLSEMRGRIKGLEERLAVKKRALNSGPPKR